MSNKTVSARNFSFTWFATGNRCSLVFALITLVLISTNPVASAETGWWNSSWQYCKQIDLVGTGTTLTDYQMAFNITNSTLSGHENSDFSDLRFTNGTCQNAGIQLSNWEERRFDSSWSYQWVKVPSIAASGNTTIAIYYGNTSAVTSVSNATITLELYDYLNTVGCPGWTVSGGTWSCASGYMSGTTTSTGWTQWISKDNFSISNSTRIVYETKIPGIAGNQGGMVYRLSGNNGCQFFTDDNNNNGYWGLSYNIGTATCFSNASSGNAIDNAAWYQIEIRTWNFNSTAQSTSTTSTINNLTQTSAIVPSSGTVGFFTRSGDTSSASIYFRNLRIMKYAYPEPTVLVGSEETQTTNTAPTITLSNPTDLSWSTSRTISHQFIPVDNAGFKNCSVWSNNTGTFVLMQANTSAINNGSTNTISATYSADGDYLWGVQCFDDGNPSLNNVSTTNRTIRVDTVAPSLISYVPSAGAVDIDINTTITLTFSENMKQSTFSGVTLKDANNTNVPLTMQSYNNGTYVAVLKPSVTLSSNKAYTVNITGLTDIAGNALPNAYWSFTTATSYNVALSKNGANGWNLISLPVVPTNTAPASVLSNVINDIVSVWTYDSVTGNWLLYVPNNPNITTLNTMTAGYGYWINYNNSVSKAITGSGNMLLEGGQNTPPQRTLTSGWNLIGYYQRENTNTISSKCAHFTLTPNINDETAKWWSLVFGYDNQNKQLTQVVYTGNMVPGQGYWIFMTSKLSTYVYGPGLSSSECV